MSIGVNVGDNALSRLGFEKNYLVMALVAVVVTGLIVHKNLFLIVVVVFLSIGANMPADFMLNFGLDRDYFVGALGALLITPLAVRCMD